MARILIAWELGEALGYVGRCSLVAAGLRQRGHEVVLALKDVRLPHQPHGVDEFQVLAAPMPPMQRVTQRPPINYAEVLISCGFADARDLAARLHAWQSMLALIQPDLVLGDYAPTALLASQLQQIPFRAIGTGFAIPPPVSPWPSILPQGTVPGEALHAAERHLDAITFATQKLLRPGQESAAVRVRDLFETGAILDTLAELDHYGPRPQGCYVGPLVALPHTQAAAWQDNHLPKVLAYLRPGVPGFTDILNRPGYRGGPLG